jgi:hypothetical protein
MENAVAASIVVDSIIPFFSLPVSSFLSYLPYFVLPLRQSLNHYANMMLEIILYSFVIFSTNLPEGPSRSG